MNSRERFLSATQLKRTDRPPIWLMRQAGRYLPEYRALKSQYDFITMVKTPELATEITLQPLKRFPLDAAIIFSDILVIPEALGQAYHFRDGGGIEMAYALSSRSEVEQLSASAIGEKLSYVGDALTLTRQSLGENVALLGFCGSPWTLACYMIEGGSSKDFKRVRSFPDEHPKAFSELMERLSQALIEYLNLQIDAGVDCVQIFDSWAAVLPHDLYPIHSLRWIERIIREIKKPIPVILYAKGVNYCLNEQLQTGARVLSLDWTITLSQACHSTNNQCALQGNLDPNLLTGDPESVERETQSILSMAESLNGFIFNLGHGMLPTAKIDCVERLVQTVTEYRWQK